MTQSSITPDVVRHIAKLAQLTITEKQLPSFTQQLQSILEYMGHIRKVPTQTIQPTSQVTGLVNVFRDDVVDEKRMLSQKEALSNAKRVYKGYFVVDHVFGI